ncbi:TonB-dependent receptor [bacterium]|nr:TonB-dependent receptor [Pseudomonadales bacterium]MDA8977914.1 TonB-dependent receptor [bacterium]MDB4430825.1 TonB-dependent receptor [Pseudomonadales bacterium]
MFKRTALFSSILIASTAHAQIEEVIVTSTKQEASTQDIPVAVTALGQEALEQLGITNFTDYLIQMPGVTAGGGGPAQNTIYIRGVASTTPNLTTSGVAGLAPNVALYLDEQPLSQPGRNLDVYAADMNRVEVLKGPQGTLFGASSQAGTVRLITNKPDPSGFSGKVKFGAAFTQNGEPSNNVEAMINAPVSDSVTLRGVVYVDNQGGYIDNVAGSITAASSARFQPGGIQGGVDLTGVTFNPADNGAKVEDDFNEVTYAGTRLSGLWQINDDWKLLVGVTQQTMDSEGVFFVDPELGDLEIQRYEDNTLEDEFVNVNWTLEGRLGALDAVYTGAFTDRESNQRVDYTDYLFAGQYIPYYICNSSVAYPGDDGGLPPIDNLPSGTCQAPNLFVGSAVETQVQTHELRFSTDQGEAIRATFGGFYSDLELRELNDFTYPGSELLGAESFGPNFSAQGSSVSDTGPYPEGVLFRNDVLRTDQQYAVFGELSIDISEQFSATFGARWYDVEVDLKGSAAGSFGNKGATTDNNAGNNLDQLFSGPNDTAQTDGVIGKVSLSWTPNENQLYYATWSEGFRPGILNRPGGTAAPAPRDYTVPFSVNTDDVTNYELGWKLDLLDGRLRLNGSAFFVEVEDLQVGIFDADIVNLFFSDNAADAEVKGVEGEFIWLPPSTDGLTVSGGFSLLDTEITESFVTDFVQEGDELAFAPELQLNLQLRQEWDLTTGQIAHVMGHVSYSDEAATDIVVPNRTMLDSWTLVGVTAGVASDQWSAELYIDNLFDKRAEISGNAIFNVDRITVARPRTVGFRVSYDI